MEERYHGEMDSLSEQLQVCESVLTEEKHRNAVVQQEISRLNQELEVCRDDALQEKSLVLEQIKVSMHACILYLFHSLSSKKTLLFMAKSFHIIMFLTVHV